MKKKQELSITEGQSSERSSTTGCNGKHWNLPEFLVGFDIAISEKRYSRKMQILVLDENSHG